MLYNLSMVLTAKLVGWALLAIYSFEAKKRIGGLARRALANMPIKFAAIENDSSSSGLQDHVAEYRKAAIRTNVEMTGFMDKRSKKLCTIIPFMGLLDLLSILAIQWAIPAFFPGFPENKYACIVFWSTLVSTIFFIPFLAVTAWLSISARKESGIEKSL